MALTDSAVVVVLGVAGSHGQTAPKVVLVQDSMARVDKAVLAAVLVRLGRPVAVVAIPVVPDDPVRAMVVTIIEVVGAALIIKAPNQQARQRI